MSNERKYDSIPAHACTLTATAFEVGDNGEGSKSAPVGARLRTTCQGCTCTSHGLR